MNIRALAFASLIGASLALCPLAALATISTISGQDDGASTAGPFTNSNAAQATFLVLASSFGPTRTETFESVPLGYATPFTIAGASVTLTGADLGAGLSGVSDINLADGNLDGFNITPGGSHWLGFPSSPGAPVGTATFTFDNPTHSFGFFTTGLQTALGTTFTVTFNDGASETLSPPINVNGGASYFGFTDDSAFSSLTISRPADDAWGIDDVSFNIPGAPGVPEPAAWTLLILGLTALGAALRRRRSSVTAARPSP